MTNNKYFLFGPWPLESIALLGFTKKVNLFGITAFQHETLPLDMRFPDHETGWEVVRDGVGSVCVPSSLEHLRTVVQMYEKQKFLADLEQGIGDLLRSKGVLMDGYTLRKVADCARQLGLNAKFKKESPCVAQDS